MRNKMYIHVCAALAIMLLLAACSSGTSNKPSGEEDASGPDPITLTMWAGTSIKDVEGYDSPNYGDWERAKAEQFQKVYPHVTINVEMVPWADIEQKVNVAIAGNNPPDILYDNVPLRVIKHAARGILEPLEQVVEEERDDWKDSFLAMGTYNDVLYALPIQSQPNVLILNKTLFEERGLEHLLPEDRKWTWEQMQDALRQVSGDDVYGTAFFSRNEQADQLMISTVLSTGSEWANEDFSKYLINSPEGVEALSMMIQMADEGLVAPGTASMTVNDTVNLFAQGKLAALHYMTTMYGTIEKGVENGSVISSLKPYGVLPVTKEGVEPKVYTTSEEGYAIFKQDDPAKAEMAREFVKFITNPDDMRVINKRTFGTPSRYSAEYTIENEDFVEISKLVNSLEVGNLGKTASYYSQLRQLFYPEIQAAFLKSKTPQQALDDFVAGANALAAGAGQ